MPRPTAPQQRLASLQPTRERSHDPRPSAAGGASMPSLVSLSRVPMWPALMLLAGLSMLSAGGCVQRRMTVRSDPPGALVYVDDYEIGNTPVSTDFVYYGTRKIRLVKDGFETLTVRQPIPLPWYQVFPLDFVTENIWPWEIRDERVVSLTMVPAATTPPEQVVARAEQSRASARILPGALAPPTSPPLPAVAPPGPPPAIPAQPLPPPMMLPPQQQPPAPPPYFPPPGYVPPSGGPTQPGGF
jgi:hypothetical protein